MISQSFSTPPPLLDSALGRGRLGNPPKPTQRAASTQRARWRCACHGEGHGKKLWHWGKVLAKMHGKICGFLGFGKFDDNFTQHIFDNGKKPWKMRAFAKNVDDWSNVWFSIDNPHESNQIFSGRFIVAKSPKKTEIFSPQTSVSSFTDRLWINKNRAPQKLVLGPIFMIGIQTNVEMFNEKNCNFCPAKNGKFTPQTWGDVQKNTGGFNGRSPGSNRWRYVNVPYFWPYFEGISPYIGLKNRPYIWNRYLQSIGSWNCHWWIEPKKCRNWRSEEWG